MYHFTRFSDVGDLEALLKIAGQLKEQPGLLENLGIQKSLVLLFFNPSLRTRLSTEKAGRNLGMQVINLSTDKGWKIEFEDQIVMDGDRPEHIREAAAVISQYADIIGIRSFPGLQDREADEAEPILSKFVEFATVPVVSLESAQRHPLQSLADLMTIREFKKRGRPKVVLSWAPHPNALPHSVPNSFLEWMREEDVELVLTHPEGYELSETFTKGVEIEYDQQKALRDADFVYAKNWSSYQQYGRVLRRDREWMITPEKMALTKEGYFMHCLPVRRNVVVADAVLDGPQSLILEQAKNRTFATQAVLHGMLQYLLHPEFKSRTHDRRAGHASSATHG